MTTGLDDVFVDFSRRLADLERRGANRSRVGRVVEVDHAAGLYRVELRPDGSTGAPYLSPWLPRREISLGEIKMHVPLSVGQQVAVISESGDLTDGVVEGATPSDANPRPHDQGGELVIEIGATRLLVTAGEVRISAAKIVLDGEVHLGGEGGVAVHRIGDVDSAGDRARTGAARVFAK